MKKILVVGYGYVGKAMVNFFKKKYQVYVYDPFVKHIDFPDEPNVLKVDDLNEKKVDMVVICVPTKMNDDGTCDTSIVVNTIMKLKDVELILVKSTVTVGTMDNIKKFFDRKLVFSPEFIGESSYWSPYTFDREVVETPWFIFGGDKKDCSEVIDFFLPITGPAKEYRITDFKTAELTKYVENVFGALKVTFCNELYDICELYGVEYN
jgi:UDP-glucose 6-dehydrogenase